MALQENYSLHNILFSEILLWTLRVTKPSGATLFFDMFSVDCSRLFPATIQGAWWAYVGLLDSILLNYLLVGGARFMRDA